MPYDFAFGRLKTRRIYGLSYPGPREVMLDRGLAAKAEGRYSVAGRARRAGWVSAERLARLTACYRRTTSPTPATSGVTSGVKVRHRSSCWVSSTARQAR